MYKAIDKIRIACENPNSTRIVRIVGRNSANSVKNLCDSFSKEVCAYFIHVFSIFVLLASSGIPKLLHVQIFYVVTFDGFEIMLQCGIISIQNGGIVQTDFGRVWNSSGTV